jgi:hypothetical protein
MRAELENEGITRAEVGIVVRAEGVVSGEVGEQGEDVG